MNSKRTVLIITHFFPPMGGGGVIRMLKFAKYLPEFGWQPIILTASINGIVKDEGLLSELSPDTKIFRTAPSLLTDMKFWLLRKVFNRDSVTDNSKQRTQKNSQRVLGSLTKFLENLKKPLESWILIPDQYISWVRPASRLAEKILRQYKVDAVLTSGPPHSVHLIGRRLQKKHNTPWLVDFRDDWYSNPLFMPSSYFGRLLVRRIEQKMLTNADRLTTVTPPIRDKIAARYPHEENTKFVTLWNGYDISDFPVEKNVTKKSSVLQLTYLGSYGKQRSTKHFFEAVTRLKDNCPDLFRLLSITFIGQFTDSREYWKGLFGTQVSFRNFITHKESIASMHEADALLLFLTSQEDGKNAMPGKFYEYMAANRPIVAFTCPGMVKDFITNHNFGWAADVNNTDEIYRVLISILDQWRAHGALPYHPDKSAINQFNRKELTKKLASLLSDITSSKSDNHYS